MYSLLIDTHDTKVTYVLFKDGIVLDKVDLESKMRHSEIAMPKLIEIISNNNLDIHDIKELIVVVGPGSFTGVRIGVVIAKTIAYLLNIPIKQVSSLELGLYSNEIIVPGTYYVEEKNGYFVCEFDNLGELVGEIKYFDADSVDISNYIKVDELNYNNIYKHMVEKESINPHLINPLYVKQIEALKND